MRMKPSDEKAVTSMAVPAWDAEGSTEDVHLDLEKVEEVGSRLLKLLNNGALTIMISIGHKTGLFETMAALPPVTSRKLAASVGLHERYVREWLATMLVGRIVCTEEHSSDKSDVKYFLPPENAAFLTWGRGPENVAVLSQYISILSSFEAKSVECFRSGKGVPVSEFDELKSIMAADAAQTIASSLIDWILPLGGGIVEDLRHGISVLDIECGSGLNLFTLAKEFHSSWFIGYDSNPTNVAVAKDSAEKAGLTNLRFECKQITETSEYSGFDLITCFGRLVETGDVRNVVQRVQQALRPNGTFLLQDVAANSDPRLNCTHPAGPLLYTISVMFLVPATLFKTNKDEEAVGVMWGNDRALDLIREIGFSCDGVKQLPEDQCNVFFFCTRK